MKKVFLLLIACALMSIGSYAQVNSYGFSQVNNTYDTLVGGKALGTGTTAAGTYFTDSTVSAGSTTTTTGIGLPIGFTFTYNGSNFDVFGVNADGWISFGQSSQTPSVNMNSSAVNTPISATSTAPAALQNRVSAFGRAISAQPVSRLRYKTIGTAPSRTLVVEWRNYRRSGGGANTDTLCFQIRLNETANTVQFIYGKMKVSSAGGTTVQVGLRGTAASGATPGDFNTRLSTTSWATTTAGTVASTVTISTTIFPAVGLTYIWTPPLPEDAGISAINSPATSPVNGLTSITTTIKNFGSDTLLNATIAWSVNGVVQTPFSWVGKIGLGITAGPVSIGSYNFTPGIYTIKAWTESPNGLADGNHANDTTIKTVFAKAYAALPFLENFNGTWVNFMATRDVPSIYWSNTPATGNSSWRRNDDTLSAPWTAGNSGTYTPGGVGTGSLLHSARFHSVSAAVATPGIFDAYLNLSPVGTKMLKFWHNNLNGNDSLDVYMSSDSGATFRLLQKFITDASWTQQSILLGTSTSPKTIIRFKAISITPATTTDIGLDSVQVYVLPANDAGVTAINSPSTSLVAGSRKVAVTLKNFGGDTLKTVTVAWSINGTIQTPFPWSGKIAYNASNGPDTIGTYNFVTPGLYTIKTWTVNPNGGADADHTNDTISKVVYVKGYAALPLSENFDHTWITGTREVPSIYWTNSQTTGNSSWRRDDDGTSAAWTTTTGAYLPAGAGTTLHSARFHSASAAAGTSGLFDLDLNFSTVGSKILKFWHNNLNGNDSLDVYLSQDSGATFTVVKKLIIDANWAQYSVNLGSSISPKSIVRFKAISVTPATTSDIGLDSVQVYIQPANDLAAVNLLAPVSGCGHTASDTVTFKFTNIGIAPQTNIPLYYSINGIITGPETYSATTVNPGDTVKYTFTQHANLSVAGPYVCKAFVGLPTDAIHNNDTVSANIVSIGVINTFPFVENFNNHGSYYFTISTTANAAATFRDTSGVNNSGCAFFTGATNTGWAGTGTISAAAAYGTYTTHHSTLDPCHVDATGLTHLQLKFDLKQQYYTQKTYTWLVLIANGTDTLADMNGVKYYNPTTTNADPFTTRIYDLTSLAGTSFTLEFKSACKYSAAGGGAPGNNNFIDNIIFFVPPTDDAGVTAMLSPKSAICGNANDSVVVVIKNYGVATQSNIPVKANINTPSGPVILTGTLPGPLAPNAIDTIKLGNINTVTPGTYSFAIYTQLVNDTVYSNDTLHASIVISPVLSIPHVEDYQGTTPLANWNVTNFLSGNGHANTSYVMYASMSNTATTASAYMNKKTGTASSRSYLTFDYRIVNNTGTTGTTLTTDSVFVLLSNDCGTTYNNLYIISALNHTTSATMKKVIIPIPSYAGTDVIPGFRVKRGATGTYFVDIDNVAISDAPVVNLGPDTAFCVGGSVVLDAGASASGYTYTYAWSTVHHSASIATTQTISADSVASYIATVNNGFGVTASDTVNVGVNALPTVSLGPDTSGCVTFTLDPGAGYSSYSWSTGATTQTLNVTTTGVYWVDVTNIHGCVARDSAHVTIIPLPTVSAGPAQSECYLDTLHILYSTATDYDSLLWTTSGDGHFINDSTLLHPRYKPGTADIAAGTVNLTITAYAKCDTVSSTFTLTITTTPAVDAGNAQTICSGNSAQLSATGGTIYAWDNSTATLDNPNIANPVATLTTTTTYTVTVTSSCGSATDNVTITVDHIALLNLGTDQTICANTSVIIDAGTGYDTYLWSTGATTHSITVDTTGIGIATTKIYVDVTKGVCSASDTVNITFMVCSGNVEYSSNPNISIFPNPTTGMTNITVGGISGDAVLNIYSMQGQSVYNKKLNGNLNTELDLSYLPKGIYFIRINNEKVNILSKLIIQ